jgi:hypothetical protein
MRHSAPSARSLDFLWLTIMLFMLLTVSFLLPIQPHDYWWYLRVGKDTVQHGYIPTVDTISFTQAGRPVFYQSWLAAVILWLTYAAGGAALTFLLRGLIISLAYGLTWGMMRQAGAGLRLASLLTILVGMAGSNNWSVRPQMFAYPLFVLAMWIVWRWQEGQNRYLWTLPLISLLWTNLHGSFVLLIPLTGAALVFGKGERKDLGFWFALTLLVTLVNPRGAGAWRYVTEMLTTPSNQLFSNEWSPPVNAGWQLHIFFAWLLLFAPLAAFAPRKLSLLEWVWLLGFGWLALSGLRYVIWFLFILSVASASLLAQWGMRYLDLPVHKLRPLANTFVGCIFLALPLALLPGPRDGWWRQAPSPYADSTPIAATQWLKDHPGLPGPLWSNFGFSSYLALALPARPVWIDTRFEIYPPSQWERYLAVTRPDLHWQEMLEQEGINLMMLSTGGEPGLIQAAADSNNWCEKYRDRTAVIFSRRAPGEICP